MKLLVLFRLLFRHLYHRFFFFVSPAVSLSVETLGKFGAAGLHYLSVNYYVDEVRLDEIEYSLVVCYNQDSERCRIHCMVDAFRHYFQRVYVKSRVRLVKYREFRSENRHLEYLSALFFAPRKSVVQVATGKLVAHFQRRHVLFKSLPELAYLLLTALDAV